MQLTQRNRLGDGLFIFCSRCSAPASVCHALWIQWLQSLSAAWWVCPAVANDIDSRALIYCKSPTSSPTLTVTVTTGVYRPHTCTRDWQSPGSRGFHGILVGMETEMLNGMGMWQTRADRHTAKARSILFYLNISGKGRKTLICRYKTIRYEIKWQLYNRNASCENTRRMNADGCSKSTFSNKRKLNEIADFTTTDIGITLTTDNDHRCMWLQIAYSRYDIPTDSRTDRKKLFPLFPPLPSP